VVVAPAFVIFFCSKENEKKNELKGKEAEKCRLIHNNIKHVVQGEREQ